MLIRDTHPLKGSLPICRMMNFSRPGELIDHHEFEIHYFYNCDKFFRMELNIDRYKMAVDRLYKLPVVMELVWAWSWMPVVFQPLN